MEDSLPKVCALEEVGKGSEWVEVKKEIGHLAKMVIELG